MLKKGGRKISEEMKRYSASYSYSHIQKAKFYEQQKFIEDVHISISKTFLTVILRSYHLVTECGRNGKALYLYLHLLHIENTSTFQYKKLKLPDGNA